MNRGIVYDGVPSKEELASCPGVPSEERMRQGELLLSNVCKKYHVIHVHFHVNLMQ